MATNPNYWPLGPLASSYPGGQVLYSTAPIVATATTTRPTEVVNLLKPCPKCGSNRISAAYLPSKDLMRQYCETCKYEKVVLPLDHATSGGPTATVINDEERIGDEWVKYGADPSGEKYTVTYPYPPPYVYPKYNGEP